MKKDPESTVTELSGRRETYSLSPASEQNACLLHEDDSDQSLHSCPSQTEEGGDDLENMAASSPLQVWFDTEVLEAHESDNLDVVATTEQHSKTVFRSDIQIEPSEEIPNSPESITSIGAREDGERVRREKRDDGPQADKGRKTRLNDVDGSVRGVKSAGRIERLLRHKRRFRRAVEPESECELPCDKQLCSFPTLSEQESGQTRQMDSGETEDEEEMSGQNACPSS